jgi:hypothetical protein
MPFTTRKKDLINATYLDRLGTSSAAQYAPIVKRQAPELGATLPLDETNARQLLTNTINGLQRSRQLPRWESIPDVRRSVFIKAWYDEMSRQGIV